MTSLPYQYNSLQEQMANDELKGKPIVKYMYWTFDFQQSNKIVGIIKRNHMLTDVVISVEQGFLPGSTAGSLRFKGSSLGSIVNIDNLANSRAFRAFSGDNTSNQDMLTVLKEDKFLEFTVITDENNTQGKGWGLITYIDMSQVPGYGRL